MRRILFLLVAVGMLFGLTTAAISAQSANLTAAAQMKDATGKDLGTATFTETSNGIQITGRLTGLTPGPHGIHIHAVGLCEPDKFTTAGAHYNPENKKHGLNSPDGPHAGDLPQITAAADGTAVLNLNTKLVTIQGAKSFLDADGAALVIHAMADDQITDPTGNSGDRVACGVVNLVTGPRTGEFSLTNLIGWLFLAAAGLLGLGLLVRRQVQRAEVPVRIRK